MIKFPVVIKNSSSGIFKHTLERYDPGKIVDKLCKETGLCEETAKEISASATRRIVASNIKFLTGPMSREFVCCELLCYGYEKERAKFTSPRIPFFDFDELVSNGHTLEEIKDHIYTEMCRQYQDLKEIYSKL